jgi:hypothetical protein
MSAVQDLATLREVVDEVHRKAGTRSVEAQLVVLFDLFDRAARTIDPSITGAWLGRDMLDEAHKPYSICFERKGREFARRRGAPS